MKNSKRIEWFERAVIRATRESAAGRKAVPAALALLLFAILCTSGCVGVTGAPAAGSGQQSTPGAATIAVAPSAIKFGSVPVGDTVSQSVTLSNTGGSSATITKASATGAGITLTGMQFPLTLGAGKQASLNVVFSPKAAGALSGEVSIVTSVSGSPNPVSVSGTAMAATSLLTSSASSLSFGSVGVGKSKAMSVTLTNAGNSNVTVSKISVSGSYYSVSGVSAGLILAPGQSATLQNTLSPAAAGNFPGSVTIVSNASNSPDTISLLGSGSQTVSHSVTLSWTPSTSAVAGYDVLRSGVSGGPYSKLSSSLVAADTYVDSSVQAGQTYYYVVTAVTAAGVQSSDSTQASATVPSP